MPKFVFHEDRAQRVLIDGIHRAYKDQKFLYNKYHAVHGVAPQHCNLPKGVVLGSQKHVLFLFFTTLVTLQSSSDEGFKRSVLLYEQFHGCFTEHSLLERVDGISTLEEIFKHVGFNKPKTWSGYWSECAETLFHEYDGDPLCIIRDVKTVDGMLLYKKNARKEGKSWWLNGYGPKLFSLFCIFCEELGLIEPVSDAIPVDVHLQRICLSTGIVTTDVGKFGDTVLAEFLRKELTRFCRVNNIAPVDISHAMWFLGSKSCSKCNRVRGLKYHCPVFSLCTGSPPTKPYWRKGHWRTDLGSNARGHPFYREHQYELFF
ncbi:MAG TPA: hypothetical protein ENI66_02020 [Candidatus Yonathbacteria bacterium]|nr:hypothetical protein [Candidatus Yonathbacteria bacterium]